ncbi:GNAT family N-acetyltransferase [Pontibacter sp. SGAir0037]|uniref:GNAT family N-acetyltransferase n=1 Tax=Pontibacter sp. SGAir0037 TaxID=2571030 RepID=UPI0010CD1AF0|nr:GNAT family N-acetyltransferase [Pontibacter sp. SGAir0037]QCR23184.1 N-acetyltransferase [Pontibacter sp. SGAir0037]
MELTVKHDKKYQQFTIELEADEEAELAYALPSDKVLDFTHTFVPESARGQGVAHKLIEQGLQFAADNGFKVIATCPAVATYINRHQQYQHLLYQEDA